jgi:hypothetical protein
MGQRRFHHEEKAEHIGAERAFDLCLGELAEIIHLVLFSGIVDQDVETAEFLHSFLHRFAAELFGADVARDLDACALLPFDRAQRLVGVLVFFEVDDGDLRALARHRHGHRPSDAAVAAGDQHDLILQLADAGVFRLVIRPRMHLRFAARLVLLLLWGLQAIAHGWLLKSPGANASPRGRFPAREGHATISIRGVTSLPMSAISLKCRPSYAPALRSLLKDCPASRGAGRFFA